MNPKTKKKVVIDIAMTILYLLLMNLALTGVLLHEVAGIGIIGLFAAHLMINRQWIGNVASRLTDKIGFKAKAMFVLNALLLGAMIVTIVSGVLISEQLFPFISASFASNLGLLLSLHAVFSWFTLGILIAHTLVHWRWIASLIRRLVPAGGLRVAGARASLVLIVAATLYSFIGSSALDAVLPGQAAVNVQAANVNTSSSSVSGSGSSNAVQGTAGLITSPAGSSVGTDEESVSSSSTSDAEVKETLQEYLSKLVCTACGKRCPLSSPRCAKGRVQAQTATATYNASLSETGITFTL